MAVDISARRRLLRGSGLTLVDQQNVPMVMKSARTAMAPLLKVR